MPVEQPPPPKPCNDAVERSLTLPPSHYPSPIQEPACLHAATGSRQRWLASSWRSQPATNRRTRRAAVSSRSCRTLH